MNEGIDKNLLLLAATAIKEVYLDDNITDIGTTEYALTTGIYNGKLYQILAIGGTDEWEDWFYNLLLLSKDGVKLGSYISVERIRKNCTIDPSIPLIVTGHSKAGPTALQYALKYGADYCVAFCPARGFRKAVKIENAILVIDPDDIVPKLGFLNFTQPDCPVFTLPKNHLLLSIEDHFINGIIAYLKKEIENEKNTKSL